MRNSSGFTLLELMIVIAVIAILAAVAIPNFIGSLPKRHLQSSTLDVQGAINLAKLTAIKENTDAVLTFDTANESYLAFIDTDQDGIQDAGERTIRNKEMSPGINLNSTSIPGHRLIFDSRGIVKSPPSGAGDITLINVNGINRTISVTLTGMSRINY